MLCLQAAGIKHAWEQSLVQADVHDSARAPDVSKVWMAAAGRVMLCHVPGLVLLAWRLDLLQMRMPQLDGTGSLAADVWRGIALAGLLTALTASSIFEWTMRPREGQQRWRALPAQASARVLHSGDNLRSCSASDVSRSTTQECERLQQGRSIGRRQGGEGGLDTDQAAGQPAGRCLAVMVPTDWRPAAVVSLGACTAELALLAVLNWALVYLTLLWLAPLVLATFCCADSAGQKRFHRLCNSSGHESSDAITSPGSGSAELLPLSGSVSVLAACAALLYWIVAQRTALTVDAFCRASTCHLSCTTSLLAFGVLVPLNLQCVAMLIQRLLNLLSKLNS